MITHFIEYYGPNVQQIICKYRIQFTCGETTLISFTVKSKIRLFGFVWSLCVPSQANSFRTHWMRIIGFPVLGALFFQSILPAFNAVCISCRKLNCKIKIHLCSSLKHDSRLNSIDAINQQYSIDVKMKCVLCVCRLFMHVAEALSYWSMTIIPVVWARYHLQIMYLDIAMPISIRPNTTKNNTLLNGQNVASLLALHRSPK